MGKFDYKMQIEVGELGQQTKVQISPNHGFSQISARLENEYFHIITLITTEASYDRNMIREEK